MSLNDLELNLTQRTGKDKEQLSDFSNIQITKLLMDLQCGIISIDDVSEKLRKMARRTDILKEHETFCKIWRATDGRWKTKLPDKNAKNKYKLVAKTSREDLENYIVNWYKEQQETLKPCLKSIYNDWIAFKEKETSMANANKLIYAWKKYYENTTIILVPFEDMTAGQMKDWFLTVICEKKLTSKQFKEMKSVINMMYDYAISYNYTSTNIPRQIRGFSDRIFKEEVTKPISETVYDATAKSEVINEALKQYEKTGNTAYLAVCLNFSLALRVGELVALKISCINDADGTIDIIREEVKTYIKEEDGTLHRNGYKVVNHTKTQCGQRKLILTPNARKYIQMAINRNKELNIADEDYIFLTKEGKRMHDHAVNNVLRRLNGVRNEKDAFVITDRPSGNHAIRKTCISELHDSRLLSDDTIKTFAGHKDISTTQKCYIHQVKPITDYATEFAKVFDAT